MDLPVRVRWSAIAVYIFAISLVQLGRFFIGDAFNLIFFIFLLLPIASLLHIFLSIASIKYYQNFDTDHPVKGEALGYTLSLVNESILPTVPMKIKFRTIQPGATSQLPELQISLKSNEKLEKTYSISCPFRGIYTVGLEQLEITDILGWITIRRPVWHRTFYVYPRIIDISYPFSIGYSGELSTGLNPGTSQDFALFESLSQYLPGESIRHMAWKKFIATGEPFLKSYGKTSQPGLSIYLDLRRDGEPTHEQLEREDCSIEILVSLVKYCLDQTIPVSVHAMGQSRYEFSASDPSDFGRFHRDTINILFSDSISPAVLYLNDTKGYMQHASVLFITHELDSDVLTIIEESAVISPSSENAVAAIINQTNLPEREKIQGKLYFDSIREKGGNLLIANGPDTIARDLELRR